MASKKRLFFDAETLELKAAAGGDDEKIRPFDMLAYSGGRLKVAGFPGGIVVDMSGVTIKASGGKLPITLDHKDSQRVGHSEEIEVDVKASQIRLSGLTSAESDARDEVLKSHKNGFRFQASIEGHTNGREFVKRGRTIRVNGRTFEGPVVVARKFVLRAVSFVSAGGDEDNQVRLAASHEGKTMNPAYVEWLGEIGLTEEDSNDKLEAKFKAELDAAEKAKDSDDSQDDSPADDGAGDVKAQLREAFTEELDAFKAERKAEIERDREIRKVCGGDGELYAKAMESDWDATRTELELLRIQREQSSPALHIREKAKDCSSDVLTACVAKSFGSDLESGFDFNEKTLEAADRYSKRGLTIHGLMYDRIAAANMSVSPGCSPDELVEVAYRAERVLQDRERELKAAAGFSTISLSGTLSNVANKYLLRSYNMVDRVVRRLASERPSKDFKLMSGYRINALGDLLPLGPDGEIKHTQLLETGYTNQIETRARMLAMTREMQINDDLGAFLQLPQAFGRSAARTEEKTGWQEIQAAIASGTFFTAGNGNLVPAVAVLNVANLTTAKQQIRELTETGADGEEFAMVQGRYLVTPPALDDTADELMNSRELMMEATDTTATAAARIATRNPHRGSFEPVGSAYFGASGFGTDTQWLIASDPNDVAFLEFAFLQGQRNPVFQSAETDFNTLGMQWRIYRDFGWSRQDPNGAVYSAGA